MAVRQVPKAAGSVFFSKDNFLNIYLAVRWDGEATTGKSERFGKDKEFHLSATLFGTTTQLFRSQQGRNVLQVLTKFSHIMTPLSPASYLLTYSGL